MAKIAVLTPEQELDLQHYQDNYAKAYPATLEQVALLEALKRDTEVSMEIAPNIDTAIRIKALERVIVSHRTSIAEYIKNYRDDAVTEVKDMGKTTALYILKNRRDLIVQTVGIPRMLEKSQALDEAIAIIDGTHQQAILGQPQRMLTVIKALVQGHHVTDIEGRVYAVQEETLQLIVKLYITNSVTNEKTESWGGGMWTDAWAELGSFRQLSDMCSDEEILRLNSLVL